MTEEQILIKGLKVNYKVFGEGKPFLILHGWRSNSDRWQKTAELIAQKNLKVIVPDLPGFGKSQEPESAWSIDNYVEWLSEFSQNIPELNKDFYLLGHSFGGTFAAKFTIKYNQKIEKLFLVAASCIRLKTPSKRFIYNVSRIIKLFYFFPFYEIFRKYFYKFILRKSDYLYVSGIMKEIYLKVIADDLSQKLVSLRAPTVIIWGEKDDLTPIEHAYIIHKKISDSKLIIIPSAGHNLHSKNTDILVQEIMENLSVAPYHDQLLSLKNII
ncbi:MAG: Alpha/beta hydrolase fold protein [Parcubacteria group bacterium GW2011_GWA1_33_6]|uniref:AB hydrolase-1 domain-containing protein n=1 Tax=Candidatus Staskawiczbacteria bacterium RIFCSPHIGHO2_02_FULL_33_16 TaxID=1802204 RepID=A0A1G2HYN6_9BACT|nr:MAG: Alpha/beta hydrolase fold protein [Parcubacteria group bacterium GW2011_GWA1_33_6]OGZ67662.1 MAG: hypothetical protein A3D34_01960 [Candidatus Staskawiczbacteria bacterium RIFCSPHIGHO2_02_FULL_33_16]OGZ70347.1 MAG: hypothetical protein A2980_01790 [Candidatus Staskawiczbacteria bacterium RIFCSPLOWO2_01_FULL_33_13]